MGSPLAGQTGTLVDTSTTPPTVLGSAQTNGQGQASVSYTPSAAGTEQLEVQYAGSSQFQPSNSAVDPEVINPDSVNTVATITSVSPSPGVIQSPVTVNFSLKTSTGAGLAGQNVSLYDNSTTPPTLLGSGQTGGGGTGSISYTPTVVATEQLQIVYAGSGVYNPSSSAIVQEVVNSNLVATATTITGVSPSPGTVGSPVTVNFTIATTP